MLQRAIRYGIPFFWDGTLNPQGCLQLGFAWIKLCNGDYTPSSWIDFCNGDPTYTDLSTGGWELYSVGATVPCIASGGAHCLGTAIPTITTAIWTSPMTGIGYPHPDFFLPSADFGVLTDLRTLALKNSGCCDCILGDGAVVTVTDAANQSVAVVIDNIG
jgi:hypothetical protein